MKIDICEKFIALCCCMMFSAVSFSQLSEPTPEPFSSSSPFEPSEKNDEKENQSDDIFYDSVTLNTPSFFDILSSPQRPFSSGVISNHSGGQNVDDPGKDCDAPIDDNIALLFIAAIVCRLRFHIRSLVIKSWLYINPIK